MRVWLLCGMLLWGAQSWGEILRVDAMSVRPEATWQRGDPVREQEDGVYMLEWRQEQGVALQVALLRQSTSLRTKPEAFLDNLAKKWAAQYGKRAQIADIQVGSRPWLSCRRPAADGSAIVFQLVTLHEGRVYSMVAFASPLAVGLPEPVHALLEGVSFGPESGVWVARPGVAAQPGKEALEALMQDDADRIGRDGLLTGYGIEYSPLPETVGSGWRQSWFLDGFRWLPGARHGQKQPISLSGHLQSKAPARIAGALNLSISADSSQNVAVEIRLLDLCAPAAHVDHALAVLARGARGPLDRLVRERAPGCPPAPEEASPRMLVIQAGLPVSEIQVLPVLPARAPGAGLTRVKLIAVQARFREGEVGEALLRQTGVYFPYVAE